MACSWQRTDATLKEMFDNLRSFVQKEGPRIGLLGGSFNPAHNGHMKISLEAMRLLRLDQVWWLVSPQNPLKSTEEMASFESRVENVIQIIKNEPRILDKSMEVCLENPFTVDTLIYLKKRFYNHRFVWLMGADNLAQLPNWYRWHQIMKRAPIAVFNRPGYSHAALSGKAAKYYRRHRVKSHIHQLVNTPTPAWTFIWSLHDSQSATSLRDLALSFR